MAATTVAKMPAAQTQGCWPKYGIKRFKRCNKGVGVGGVTLGVGSVISDDFTQALKSTSSVYDQELVHFQVFNLGAMNAAVRLIFFFATQATLARARASWSCLALVALAFTQLPAYAQFRVEVTGVGLTQLPLAVAPFKGEDAAPQKVSAILLADWSAAVSSGL